jgi:hypothetical protein
VPEQPAGVGPAKPEPPLVAAAAEVPTVALPGLEAPRLGCTRTFAADFGTGDAVDRARAELKALKEAAAARERPPAPEFAAAPPDLPADAFAALDGPLALEPADSPLPTEPVAAEDTLPASLPPTPPPAVPSAPAAIPHDTVMDLPPFAAAEPQPVVEATRRYSAQAADEIRAAIDAARQAHKTHHARPGAMLPTQGPRVRRCSLVEKAEGAFVLLDEAGAVLMLPLDLVRGVAVGVVERGYPEAADLRLALLIDVVMDFGGPDVQPEVVRLHPSAAVLDRMYPWNDRASAISRFARDLAMAGAVRMPLSVTWPGPPWPRYPDVRAFVKAWQAVGREMAS